MMSFRHSITSLIHLLLLVAATMTLLSIAAVSKAEAQGSSFMYIYDDAFCPYPEQTVDPIHLVFLSAPSWTDVDYHWRWHLGAEWWYEDSDVNQNTQDVYSGCKPMQRERATGGDLAFDRRHARMMEYGYAVESESLRTGWHVHAAAHKEESGPFSCGHSVTANGYNEARNEVVDGFTGGGHTLIDWEWWGNIQLQTQCNKTNVASDGYAAYISIGHAGGNGDE